MATTYEMTVAMVDELVAHGLRHVCISPGSRSAPLALTVARHPALSHWVHHDERSAAFFALGIAKATGVPTAVVTTSGTATAELHPAVIEARFGRVPLLLLTADRPPSLRGTGANQTIDQVDLFGSTVKLFADAPLAAVTTEGATRSLAARSWTEAASAPAGPVHINFPFDEPLTPQSTLPEFGHRPETVTWTAPSNAPDETSVRALAELCAGGRGLILAGPRADSPPMLALLELAQATGFPVLADPLSDLRVGRHDGSRVIGHYDALAQAGFLEAASPEVAIRFGAVPTSKALNTWLADHPEVAYATVDTTGWRDPGGTAQLLVTADPDTTARQLAKLTTTSAAGEWLHEWLSADQAAARNLDNPSADLTELTAIHTVLDAVPEPTTVWVASSMPIRHVDLMLGAREKDLRLLGNRGASGIDGFLSSGIGSAMATGEPTVLIAGDLSFLHDLTALAWAGRHRTDITMVLINNDGGGIFHLLPPADLPEFEELFGTPHGLDFSQAARLFDVEYSRASTAEELTATVATAPDGPRVVEARFDRAQSVEAYRMAVERVRRALGG